MRMSEKEKNSILHVRISKASKLVWEGDARSVSSKNSDGSFDILPMHSNFVTLVREDPIIIVTEDGNEKKYVFKQSVIFVTENKVKIFSNLN
jgi:F0F1-type ATP synthase epsilon subunit